MSGRGGFSGVWRPELLSELDRAAVAIGHTRRAAPGSPAEIIGVVQALAGRGALAWVERDRPTEVHLARGALSPLTMAVDTDQNIYWASEPRWFREVERHTRVRFATVVLLREGAYLKVGMERRPGRRDLPEVLATAFAPAARRPERARTPGRASRRRRRRGPRRLLQRVVERAGGTGGLLTVA
ncbi:hypothetical protein ACFQY7_47240 [Actinomadura luteofluorescens]|uniref:hypothetical protein n=1 Tax=Actinomadura luteofluorescens TaxID=46163 RepID=UPI00364293ED